MRNRDIPDREDLWGNVFAFATLRMVPNVHRLVSVSKTHHYYMCICDEYGNQTGPFYRTTLRYIHQNYHLFDIATGEYSNGKPWTKGVLHGN